jgi:hypothetical protein
VDRAKEEEDFIHEDIAYVTRNIISKKKSLIKLSFIYSVIKIIYFFLARGHERDNEREIENMMWKI